MNGALKISSRELEDQSVATAAETAGKPVLDACCGSRMMWFDKQNPSAIFADIRHETLTVTDRTHREDGTRTLRIEPDQLMDFRNMPFADGSFKLVAFDPPHLERAGPKSWLAAKYGKLSDDWRSDLRAGFAECFRVLEPEGVLVFKWNETQVKVSEVLALTPHKPLFGQVSGRSGMTHWLVFMKPGLQEVAGGEE
ncbi:hypothetical protein ACUIHB_00285 [Aeromonas veronii]|uniref:hypothetical protein n=1 Tax=Aeromonas veronii TaxID=654 RepID=UPI00403E2C4C